MKQITDIPDKRILLFKSCLVSTEYPGIESSTKFLFDELGVDYHISDRQSCCTGLGYYFDLFDQMPTTAIAARNFAVARNAGYPNIATLCATCYAINKRSCKLLNSNEPVREKINSIFKDKELQHLEYTPESFHDVDNFYHVVEIIASKDDEIKSMRKIEFSGVRIATHHACHYYKVQYEDVTGNPEKIDLIDRIADACGGDVIDWYENRTLTCGAGFSQRYINRKTSLEVTHSKLESLKEMDVELVLHMCPNCQIQYDRYQPAVEKEFNTKYDIIHMNIAQFAALALGADPDSVCGFKAHSVPLDDFLKK